MSINLISVSGRIGSGKDLVAKIIRRLDMHGAVERGVIGAQSLPNMEALIKGDPFISSHWKIRKFAGSLKQIASILTGIPVEKFEDQEFKKQFLSSEWDYQIPSEIMESTETVTEKMTVRSFLQKLGTNSIRNHLHKNTWVNALFNSIEPEEKTIITDTRFPNEIEKVESVGGITILVVREGTKKEDEHISEKALDGHKFMHVIENNGTAEELEQKVKNILIERGVL